MGCYAGGISWAVNLNRFLQPFWLENCKMIHGRNIEEKNKSYIKNFINFKLCMSYTFKLLLLLVLCHIKSLCVLTEKLYKY